MPVKPQWATPERQTYLVSLFLKSGGFCVFGEPDCTIPEHHYAIYIERLIGDWKADTRSEIAQAWRRERRAIHDLGEMREPIRGQFNNISRDIWGNNQPLFYIENIGVSGVTLKPFARVKLPSSYLRLYVDLSDTLQQVSKNKKRKAIRYGKPDNSIIQRVKEAVLHYLNN